MLEGKKTYIAAAVIGIVTALQYLGIIDAALANTILGFAAAIGLYAVRDAIKKN